MPHLIESEKAYPRDILSVGRIKVMMKSENGIPSNPNIKKSIKKKMKINQFPKQINMKNLKEFEIFFNFFFKFFFFKKKIY